jgi:CBS domain containing-hemolysin-like protein
MIGLLENFLHFDFVIFSLSFLATELLRNKFPKLKLLIVNGKKRIKFHHAYIGAILAFFSALTGQIALLNISLGTMVNDLVCHIKEKISKFFKKSK